jgi:predicted nucleotidyltransferase
MRIKLIDSPNYQGQKPRNPSVHAKIKHFSEVPIVQQHIFRAVKKFVNQLLPETKCYAYGSRINGNWIETSDYDIVVMAKPSSEIKLIIARKEFMGKVDIRYTSHLPASLMVEII